MKRLLNGLVPVLLLLLSAQAGAQSFVSMGRLFTTPGERIQLDAQRNQAPVPGSAAAAGSPAAGALAPGLAQALADGHGTGAAAPGGALAGHGRHGGLPARHSGCPPGASPGAAAGAEAQPPGLRLDGVVRRSNGGTLLIVNGEVQAAPPGGIARGTVTLQADGRSIVLKPGQRYDPATGVIHEAAR